MESNPNSKVVSNYLDVKFLIQIVMLFFGIIFIVIIQQYKTTEYSTPGFLIIISVSVAWFYLIINGLVDSINDSNINEVNSSKGFYGFILLISSIIVLVLLYNFHDYEFPPKLADSLTIISLILTMSVDVINRLLKITFKV